MSIAAISSAFTPLGRIGTAVEAVGAVEPAARSAPVAPHDEGRRRELVDVTALALGLPSALNANTQQAVFRFAQALMHDLRTVGGDGDESVGAHDAGRRAWNDLPQRLSALATAAGQSAAAELPDTPNPVTPATAAVHIMKVPSSRLLEAFVLLQRAMGHEPQATSPEQSRRALADLAQRLAGASPGNGGPVKAGAVLDVRA